MFPEWLRSGLNLAQALRSEAPHLHRSILGEPASWSVESCPPTELQLLEPRNWLRAAETLAHLSIPALPRRLPAWARLRPRLKPAARLLMRPSRVYRFRPALHRPDPSPDQAWFFLNGIGTDRHLLMLNAAYLTELFQRPLTLLHNASCGLLPDLAESTVGHGWNGVSEAVRMAFAPIYVALKQPRCRRVVLLAHSQGTVVTSILLWLFRGLYPPTSGELLDGEPRCAEQRVARALAERWGFPCALAARSQDRSAASVKPPITTAELAKLEIYAFANCANLMGAIDRKAGLPYVESYGNEHDLFARLGVLAPPAAPRTVRIGGERFVRRAAWGHLLNAHYLFPMEQEWRAARATGALKTGLKPLPGNTRRHPRLFDYFGGGSPTAVEAPTDPPATEFLPASRAAAA